jgi:hypothetical protein
MTMNETGNERTTSPGSRLHLVLVPGFAGFDALGQIEYYAGVTPRFRDWQARGGRNHVVLHYFDNFPTAAVVTRAGRLRRYLAKRIARGEFQPDDSLALVGHSTGGLDIRRVLWDLTRYPDEPLAVDGVEDVKPAQILKLIKRVVFLSVPQWGTNIADWVRENVLGRAVLVAQLRTSVAASQVPLLNRIQSWISSAAASRIDIGLLHAIHDALREAEGGAANDSMSAAMAHEAASQLELWLRHIASDFSAIEDLAPGEQHTNGGCTSPAHFPSGWRVQELANWSKIRTRSYATVSESPFRFETGKAAPRWDLLKAWTWPDLTPRAAGEAEWDIFYRYCYRACAGGPFQYPGTIPVPQPFGASRQRRIELWDNDGIVNTASMLWPHGEETLLVECDHMDIVGHYDRVRPGVYDLLGSGSKFGEPEFTAVWKHIFDFCSAPERREPRARRAAAQG